MAFTQSVTSLVSYLTCLLALCPKVPFRHSFHEIVVLVISGERRQKHPLIRKQEVVAVRHRLRLSYWQALDAPFVVELFAVRFIHHLIAECKSLHPVPPVTRPRVPHASEVERAFTGTFTRIAPKSFHPFPLGGI